MAYKIEARSIHGYQVNIYYDECADPPDAFDDENCFLGEISSRRRITFGRKGWDKDMAVPYIPCGEGPWSVEGHNYYDSGAETEADIKELYEEEREWEYEVFAVEHLDYGANGSKLRFCDHEDADGYIFVSVPWTRDCPVARLSYEISDDYVPLKELAEVLLKTWNKFLGGDVYYVTLRSKDGNILEACGGLYGMEGVNDWINDWVDIYKDKTEKVDFLVIRADMTASIVSLDVPLYVGETWCSWLEDHPLSNDNTVLQIVKYNPIVHQQEVASA